MHAGALASRFYDTRKLRIDEYKIASWLLYTDAARCRARFLARRHESPAPSLAARPARASLGYSPCHAMMRSSFLDFLPQGALPAARRAITAAQANISFHLFLFMLYATGEIYSMFPRAYCYHH